MHVHELAEILDATLTPPAAATAEPRAGQEITGVTHNAAWTQPGNVFVAIRGARADGHAFIADAAAAGAIAVVGEGLSAGFDLPLPYLQVADARTALAEAAAALAGYPSRELAVVGITGTDGKTTTAWLTRHLHRRAGLATGLLSTVGYELPDGALRQFPDHFTTPESPQVQEILREMVAAGARAAVLETSSHALALKRVHAVDFDTAVWTNLTSEHLDFHGTLEQYFEDKASLFDRAAFAVVNIDDEWGRRLLPRCAEAETYSATGAGADWVARDVTEHPTYLSFTVESPLGEAEVQLPMVGPFNVANALAAMAATARSGASLEQLVNGIAEFPGVPGRMQLVLPEGPHVGAFPRTIIDFAHTPAALENLLETLRPSTQDRLWVLIGAPGQRDTTKRGPMGEVTTRLADVVVFTEDDPRDDPISHIITEMVAGTQGRTNYLTVPDRTEAITYALTHAGEGDTVVLAGKGAEMFIAREHGDDPWDEAAVAFAALAARDL